MTLPSPGEGGGLAPVVHEAVAHGEAHEFRDVLQVDLPGSWSSSADQIVRKESEHSHDVNIGSGLSFLAGDSYSIPRATYSGTSAYEVDFKTALGAHVYLLDVFGMLGDLRASLGGRFALLSRKVPLKFSTLVSPPTEGTVQGSQSMVLIELPFTLEWVPAMTSNSIASMGLGGSVGPLFGLAGRSSVAPSDSFSGLVVQGEMFFLLEALASDVTMPRLGAQVAATQIDSAWIQPRWSVNVGIEI